MHNRLVYQSGRGLENFIAEVYTDLGYRNIRQNCRLTKKSGYKCNAEIDIIYEKMGIDIFVECKYHGAGMVQLSEYAKFARVLDLLEIPKRPFIYRAEMVTNQYFDERTKQAAAQDNIKLVDIDEINGYLAKNKQFPGMLREMIHGYEYYKSNGVIGFVKYLLQKRLPIESRIRILSK